MKKDLSDLLKPERSELIHNQKWFFVKIFEKKCFSVRFGSFRLRSMNTLNGHAQRTEKYKTTYF